MEDGSQTWSWNGSEYGSWPDTPHLPSTTLWPRNKIDIIVRTTVEESPNGSVYKYTIYNKPTSVQYVDFLRVWGRCDSIKGNPAPVGWEGGYNPNKGGDGAFFSYWNSNITGHTELIYPGEMEAGFATIACGLPTIVKYDVQGYNQPPQYRLMTNQQVMEIEREDETSNSIHGYTIAPADPPSPFVPMDFLDTLISYKNQSVTLGWLTNGPAHEKDESDDRADEGIVERLDRRLDKAKDALAKSDSVKARLELALFVKEVEQLYGKEDKGERSKEKGKEVLTSEAYALLKYNAEYLIDRLPERHGRGEKEKR